MGESVDRASPPHSELIRTSGEEAGRPTLSQPTLPLEPLWPLGKVLRALVPASWAARRVDW